VHCTSGGAAWLMDRDGLESQAACRHHTHLMTCVQLRGSSPFAGCVCCLHPAPGRHLYEGGPSEPKPSAAVAAAEEAANGTTSCFAEESGSPAAAPGQRARLSSSGGGGRELELVAGVSSSSAGRGRAPGSSGGGQTSGAAGGGYAAAAGAGGGGGRPDVEEGDLVRLVGGGPSLQVRLGAIVAEQRRANC
jgi:hypothetical protein